MPSMYVQICSSMVAAHKLSGGSIWPWWLHLITTDLDTRQLQLGTFTCNTFSLITLQPWCSPEIVLYIYIYLQNCVKHIISPVSYSLWAHGEIDHVYVYQTGPPRPLPLCVFTSYSAWTVCGVRKYPFLWSLHLSLSFLPHCNSWRNDRNS